MDLTLKAIELFNLLPKGSDEPKPRRILAQLINVDVRTISILTKRLISAGVPVGSIRDSDKAGLFIITNFEELKQTTAPLESDALQTLQRSNQLNSIDLATWEENFYKHIEGMEK